MEKSWKEAIKRVLVESSAVVLVVFLLLCPHEMLQNHPVGWWGWLGVIPLATGLLRWCPPYALLGFNTCSMKDKNIS